MLVLPAEKPIHRAHVRSCLIHSALIERSRQVCVGFILVSAYTAHKARGHGESIHLRRWYARSRGLPFDVRGIAL